jgi:hypothetical protein
MLSVQQSLARTFGCKDMNEHLIADLHRFVDERGVTMSETSGHVKLNIVRSHVSLSILIPRGVPEWWIEVSHPSSGKKVEDWCGYAGYDALTQELELSEDMRADVLRFIENVLVRPLRMVKNGRSLEWHAGRDWHQAVPLADAGQGEVRKRMGLNVCS